MAVLFYKNIILFNYNLVGLYFQAFRANQTVNTPLGDMRSSVQAWLTLLPPKKQKSHLTDIQMRDKISSRYYNDFREFYPK